MEAVTDAKTGKTMYLKGDGGALRVITGTVDAAGNFTPGTAGAGGGGSGGPSLADLLLSDNAGVLFIARDNGTTITYVRLDTGAAYVPVAPVRVAGVQGVATDANLTTIGATNHADLLALSAKTATDANLTTIGNTQHADMSALTAKIAANLTAAGNISALNSTLPIACGQQATIGVQVSGNGTGFSLQPQASMDNGASWIAVSVIAAGAGALSTPLTAVTANGNYEFNAGGYTNFQLRTLTGATTGAVTASLAATPAQKFIRSTAIGDQADAAATTTVAGSFSVVAVLKGLLARFLPCTITQSVITVTTASQQVVPANPSRKYLSWMVVGPSDVTIAAGASAAVAGAGMVYQGVAAGKQGASDAFVTNVPSNAFQCIAAAAGSTLIVWEGV